MIRPSVTNRKMLALALLAGAGGACSNEDASNTTGQEEYVQQIQSELDAAALASPATFDSVRPVRPVLKCVEKLPNNQFKGHFGYVNSASNSISIPVGFFNRFWPPPIGRGQPTTFASGTQTDVVQVPFSGFSASIWVLGNHFVVATKYSKLCPVGGTGGANGAGGAGMGGSGAGGAGMGGSGAGGVGMGGSGAGGSGAGGAGMGGSGAGGAGMGGSGAGGSGMGGSGTGGAGMGGAGGACALSSCDDHNPCTIDTIDRTNCVCVNIASLDGTTCDDGNACTTVDSCQSGACVGGAPKTCAALDQCHVAGVCAPATGVCSNPAAPNGVTCNDGNACTQSDICLDGICTMGTPILCNAPDACHTAGTCDRTTGACSNPSAPNGTTCNDSNACTTVDTCQAGACTGSSPKSCAPSDACHIAGACNPSDGTCTNPSAPNGTTCSDSNACTSGDVCQAGSCVGGTPVVCPAPTDACHLAGSCNATTGQCASVVAPDGTACDDGQACTSGDACRAGVCTAAVVNPPTHCSGLACDECTFGVQAGQADVCSATADNCFNCDPSTDGCDAIADPTDKALCESLYACMVAPTHPGTTVPGPCTLAGDTLACWCGTNPTTCASSNTAPTQANGPCLAQVFAAAKSQDAAAIFAIYSNPNFPLGRAANLATCRSNFCSTECSLH